MGAIRLTGMRFHAIIGDLPHEREHPQPIEVDVDIDTDIATAARHDSVAHALDYRIVYATVESTVTTDAATAPRLLETLCVAIADAVAALDRVAGVTVRCRKPWAALGGQVERVEVEISRP